MNLKKIVLVICCLFTIVSIKAKENTDFTTINGQFKFQPKQESVMLYNVVDGALSLYTTTLINENNQFGFTVPVASPGFYIMDYGQMRANRKDQLIRFYLEPGLDMDITVEENNYTLSGKALGHNLLVQKANKVYDEFSIYSKLGGGITYEDFYPFLENKGVKMVKDFKNAINTKNKVFNDLLKIAVQTDFEANSYHFFRMPRTKHPENFNDLPSIFNEFEKKNKFNDPDILKMFNGYGCMTDFFSLHRLQKKTGTERLTSISTAITQIPNDQLKEVFVRNQIQSSNFKPDEYKKIIGPLYQYLTSNKSKDFLVAYEKELHKNIGQPGFDFTYNNVEGKPVSFSDFKGKYVYIDVWATWCAPCKKEIPHLKELEEDYRDKDIVFMSISIDQVKDEQKWKDFVKSEELKGVQLMADKDFKSGITENYDINAIPRFLLFDKEGKIVSTDAMRPSNPEIRNQFNELLGTPQNKSKKK